MSVCVCGCVLFVTFIDLITRCAIGIKAFSGSLPASACPNGAAFSTKGCPGPSHLHAPQQKNGLKLPPTHGPAPNHYISTQHRSSPPPLLAWLLRYEEPFSRQRALMAVPEPALVCLRETVTGRQWSRHARACAHIHFYTHHRLKEGCTGH